VSPGNDALAFPPMGRLLTHFTPPSRDFVQMGSTREWWHPDARPSAVPSWVVGALLGVGGVPLIGGLKKSSLISSVPFACADSLARLWSL
jgi:hypothetical protein